MRYFKLVALHDPDWLASEFMAGRVRFGWSGPGTDLRILRGKSERSAEERISWRYTKFLIERLHSGDRVVCQFKQPLREFFIGEVLERGYEFDPANREDFNHILHVKPLTERPVSIIAPFVSASLRHDLTKRGQYYEVYPQNSVRELEQIVQERLWESSYTVETRTEEDEFTEARRDLQRHVISSVSNRWKAKYFETFCKHLCEQIPHVEVKARQDTKQGWDLLVRIMNPVTGAILLDDVPVQCKNYRGRVEDDRPIEDLERCIKNSGSRIAYLFIFGELSESFLHGIDQAAERLSDELKKPIELVVVDQDRIADLYLQFVGQVPCAPDK